MCVLRTTCVPTVGSHHRSSIIDSSFPPIRSIPKSTADPSWVSQRCAADIRSPAYCNVLIQSRQILETPAIEVVTQKVNRDRRAAERRGQNPYGPRRR